MKQKLNGSRPAGPLSAPAEDEKASFTVRLYPELLREIAAVLENIPKRHRPDRNQWIEQAIGEKLRRDKKRMGMKGLTGTGQKPPDSEVSPAGKRSDEDNLL